MNQLIEKMKATQQGKQSVYEHGESVRDHAIDLISHLRDNTPLKYEWKIPEFFHAYGRTILDRLYSDSDIETYALFHDCGKPDCYTKDPAG